MSRSTFNAGWKLNPLGLGISGIAAVSSYVTIFKSKTEEATTAQSTFNEELERTKAAMDLIANVKVSADNFNFLTDRQKQQLKSDALRGIDQLDDMITKGMIANKQWYESEKQTLIAAAKGNAALQTSYLSGLEHDLNDRMQVIAGYIEEKKRLEGIAAMVPEEKKTVTDTGSDPDESQKDILQREQLLYAQRQAQLKEIYAAGNDENLQTEAQYQERLLELKKDYLNRTIQLSAIGSKEAIDAQSQLSDMLLAEKKNQIQRQIDSENTLYEQQQTELKELYISGNDENLRDEQMYNEAMEQLTLLHLQRMLDIAGLNADQRKAIEKQLLDFKVKCIQDEEKERQKALENEQKLNDKAVQEEKNRLDAKTQQYRRYGEQIGDVVGQVISNQENALQGFADTMIDVLFDVLGQLIDIEIAKATTTAVGAVARATAESMAQPDSVMTFGAAGAARAAVLSGLIMAALAAAKSALKGLIPGRSSSSSSTTSDSDTAKTATVKVSQWASGNYDVIGADDGKAYNNIPFIGQPASGIVRRTSLISENGSELIVNAEDLARLQRHIDYPWEVSAKNDTHHGRIDQRAKGNYSAVETSKTKTIKTNSPNSDIGKLIDQIKELMLVLKQLKAYVVLRDLEEMQELDRKSKNTFTKKEK